MIRTTRWLIAMTLAGLGFGFGCSSGSVNLGGNQNTGGSAGVPAGTWTGYAEGMTFQPSGSDQVRLVLDAQGNGTLQVGNDPLLPPPTDPNVGYPPGNENPKVAFPPDSQLLGGVLYPIHAAQFGADGVPGRIQFGLKPLDYYAAWCALQTPVQIVDGCTAPGGNAAGGHTGHGSVDAGLSTPAYVYSILPGVPAESSTDPSGNTVCTMEVWATDCTYTQQPVDCGKYSLAFSTCDCTATSCAPSPTLPPGTLPSAYSFAFDGALDNTGTALSGTLANNTVSPTNKTTIHLTRQ